MYLRRPAEGKVRVRTGPPGPADIWAAQGGRGPALPQPAWPGALSAAELSCCLAFPTCGLWRLMPAKDGEGGSGGSAAG